MKALVALCLAGVCAGEPNLQLTSAKISGCTGTPATVDCTGVSDQAGALACIDANRETCKAGTLELELITVNIDRACNATQKMRAFDMKTLGGQPRNVFGKLKLGKILVTEVQFKGDLSACTANSKLKAFTTELEATCTTPESGGAELAVSTAPTSGVFSFSPGKQTEDFKDTVALIVSNDDCYVNANNDIELHMAAETSMTYFPPNPNTTPPPTASTTETGGVRTALAALTPALLLAFGASII